MESLQELFPDVDSDELLAIYESTDRNVEAAVELLLSNAEERLLSSQRLLPPDALPTCTNMSHASSDAQIAQDEEIARQLQEELYIEDQQFIMAAQQQPQLSPLLAAAQAHYPGQELAPPYHANYPAPRQHGGVHRPSQWGADAPRATAELEGGYGLSDSIYSAGSAAYTAASSCASSWWNWATSDGADAKREEGEDEAHGGREMQPLRSGNATTHAQDGRREHETSSPPRIAGADLSNDTGEVMTQVVRVDNSHSGSCGGGEVRRRTRHGGQATD